MMSIKAIPHYHLIILVAATILPASLAAQTIPRREARSAVNTIVVRQAIPPITSPTTQSPGAPGSKITVNGVEYTLIDVDGSKTEDWTYDLPTSNYYFRIQNRADVQIDNESNTQNIILVNKSLGVKQASNYSSLYAYDNMGRVDQRGAKSNARAELNFSVTQLISGAYAIAFNNGGLIQDLYRGVGVASHNFVSEHKGGYNTYAVTGSNVIASGYNNTFYLNGTLDPDSFKLTSETPFTGMKHNGNFVYLTVGENDWVEVSGYGISADIDAPVDISVPPDQRPSISKATIHLPNSKPQDWQFSNTYGGKRIAVNSQKAIRITYPADFFDIIIGEYHPFPDGETPYSGASTSPQRKLNTAAANAYTPERIAKQITSNSEAPAFEDLIADAHAKNESFGVADLSESQGLPEIVKRKLVAAGKSEGYIQKIEEAWATSRQRQVERIAEIQRLESDPNHGGIRRPDLNGWQIVIPHPPAISSQNSTGHPIRR